MKKPMESKITRIPQLSQTVSDCKQAIQKYADEAAKFASIGKRQEEVYYQDLVEKVRNRLRWTERELIECYSDQARYILLKTIKRGKRGCSFACSSSDFCQGGVCHTRGCY